MEKHTAIQVSIPVWFDWEDSKTIVNFISLSVSIPVWFDWERFEHCIVWEKHKFQFQYGSIGRQDKAMLTYKGFVSIPVWFDWE